MSPLGRIGGHVDAGVIPLQNLVVALPLLGQGVGAVLAHAHAVAVAGDGEGDTIRRGGDREAGGAQAEQGTQASTAHGDAADVHRLHPAGGIGDKVGKPARRLAGQIGLRVLGQQLAFELVQGHRDGGVVVGHLVPLGAVHAGEVGHRVAPHLHRVHRPSGGGGEEHRLDGLALEEGRHAVGIRHGGGDLVGVGLGVLPPVGGGVRRVDVGLAAGDVGAHVGVRVGLHGALHLGEGVGAGGHRLGLEGLRLKGGGHLRRHHPPQVLVQRQGEHLPVLQGHPHLYPAVRRLAGGDHGAVDGQGAGGGGGLGRPGKRLLPQQEQRQQKQGEQQHQGGGHHLLHSPSAPSFLQVLFQHHSDFARPCFFQIDCLIKREYNIGQMKPDRGAVAYGPCGQGRLRRLY